jgi:hypothetical protein
VREVLVTVRKIDWHIVSKRVEFQHGLAVEATEIAYSITDLPPMISLPNSSRMGLHAITTRSPVARLPVPAADLDRAELRVREILFQHRAELATAEAPISLTRTGASIRIDGVISAPDARMDVKRSLASIPGVSDQIRNAVAFNAPPHLHPRVHEIVSTPDEKQTVDPPLLRKKLIQSLGGEHAATAFANRILEESNKSFLLSVQDHDLAQRFPLVDEKRLPASVRAELGHLTREIETALKTQLNDEADLLAPILGNEPGEEREADPDWHNRADTLFRLASLKEQIVSRLFAVTEDAASMEMSADEEEARLRKCLQDMTASIP